MANTALLGMHTDSAKPGGLGVRVSNVSTIATNHNTAAAAAAATADNDLAINFSVDVPPASAV